jgi:acyl dehydratase
MTTATGVAVGEERTEAFPPLTRTMFVRYAGASGDFNPMHHDDTIATQVGNPSVFGHGMLTMGLAARVVKDWFGPESIRRLQVRFSKQVWPGDVLAATATVTGVRDADGVSLVDLDLVVVNQNGDKAITGSATAAAS